MASRSIASLSLTFGLVSIPVKLFSATESSSAIRFKLMGAGGTPVRQQYVADEPAQAEEERPVPEDRHEAGKPVARRRDADSRVFDFPAGKREIAPFTQQSAATAPAIIDRSDMVKAYEFEKGKYVLFDAEELKALAAGSRQTIDIVAFVPEHSVDPIYYDKAYFLAPDKRGAKPYSLLLHAMRDTGRCALAKWAFRSKEYVVEIRPTEGGMVLQQLLYAEEVRSPADLGIEDVVVSDAELDLAKRLIEQISVASYDPRAFVDEEKRRILAAVEEKIAGKQIVAPAPVHTPNSARVVDLVEALRASLRPDQPRRAAAPDIEKSRATLGERKPVKRASSAVAPARRKGRELKR